MMVSSSSGEDTGHPSRQHLPPIPPSPTLSNPDMILPFDPNERESSTPSPPFNLPSLSNLQAFYARRPALDDNTDQTQGVAQPGIALSYGSRPQKKVIPRHTWLHEGHDARRLSDIGEEDSSSSSYAHFPGFSGASRIVSQTSRLGVSPVTQREISDLDTRDSGAWSGSSSSTASGASDTSWDGTKDHQDSCGAKEHLHQVKEDTTEAGHDNEHIPSLMPSAQEEGSGVELSSAVLSTEAERILENAKKRLTLMEGNLNRARTSVRVSPSLPTSPTPPVGQSPLGLGQPVGGLYQSISRADRRVSNHRPRTTYTSAQDGTNNRHSRVYSETKLPSSAQSSLSAADSSLSRSLSALGSTSASKYRSDERTFRYDPTRSYLTHRASISSMQRPAARSPPIMKERASSESPTGLGISTEDAENHNSNREGFNETYPAHDPPSRSQSQMQVRDLHNQMKGLHIKISSLKVRTQEDNLRRRSMQSLRTPSPLNAADQWYPSALDLKTRQSSPKPNVAQGQPPDHFAESRFSGGSSPARHVSDAKQRQAEPREQVVGDSIPKRLEAPQEENYESDDAQSVNESLYEDAQEGDYDESGFLTSDNDYESLNDDLDDTLEAFPPVPQSVQDTPHEEREDAFDYEHFILHSALGNYSHARLRRESNVSTSSVETTRPTDHRLVRHSRANSTTSLSSVGTFETAIEGHDGLESVLYWDQKFNDELNNRHPTGANSSNGADLESERSQSRAVRRQPSRLARTDAAATPTSLASSLVSSVRAASSSQSNAAVNGSMGLNDDDTRLLEQLFQSLGDVCTELQTTTTSAHPDPKQVRLLRRRLEAARRVLDGELDT
ncbi:uncharacterized protein BP01DRAFT_321468 [Aspergillus saccharolyticus JOP 1030-1]|uniref:Uncharacterized protein n=1 Tax=Aspergillus saccharolyticus JOP 1030-1 TaxID=1450539 RepID=A0A318ZD39_9EURO|nr:hypothetical protein BP01DRAFT_321468 [Aspergillus saccharolyticus JOP 1030-1]PYH44487.1 hypothetical protein BP01DRAFT_321468 [Aspergillus saccharolyticus JOP 1030-1]